MILTDLDFATVSETKSGLSALLKRLKGTRRTLAVTSHGKPSAVLMAFEEYRRLTEDLKGMEAALKAIKESAARERSDAYSVSDDPVAAFRGLGKGKKLLKVLLEERRRDREKEDAKRG